MHLWHFCVWGELRSKAFKHYDQTFVTSTTQSCAALHLHKPGGQQHGCQQHARRMQRPSGARCSASFPAASRNQDQSSFQVFFFPPVLSLSCTYYRLLIITYFATSSSTKSPARIALILGGRNYLIEIAKFGALVAHTLPAKLIVLTARAESCATALLLKKPRLVSDNWDSHDKTSVSFIPKK